MKFFNSFLISVAIFFFEPLSLQAKNLSIKDLKEIQSKLKKDQFMTVDFEQDVYQSLRNKHKISVGIAHFRKPQNFRWILLKPIKTEWIFDGSSLYSYNPLSRSANKFGGGAKAGLEIKRVVDMVMSFDTLLEGYNLKNAEQTGHLVLIEMTPKKSRDILSANLTLDLKKNYISQVKLFFRGKNHTTFNFKDPRPSNLGTSIFTLPKGTKVKEAF
jgi:outer membrane lipoprotein-sorting protein